MANKHLPETRPLPDDTELCAIVAGHPRPPITLKEVCGKLWPDLPWAASDSPGADSAYKVRTWPGGRKTGAGMWLREKLDQLTVRGFLRHGVTRRDEVDDLAGLTYFAVQPGLQNPAGVQAVHAS